MFRNVLRAIHRILVFFFYFKYFGRWLLPHASCIFVQNKDGLILAVSRKDDATKFGLPGGKVDPGETDIAAAKRELKEETGIDIPLFCLRKIFEDTDDFEYWTTCYYACIPYSSSIGKLLGEKSSGESGEVKWVDRDVLTSGIFGTFNTNLFKTIYKQTTQCLFCGYYHE